MHEVAVAFGEANNLVGVRTESVEPNTVGVLMLTPGMLHHVGPNRLHVQLARDLAARGYESLRFCLSGIGESLASPSSKSSIERAVSEIQQAMDFLQQERGMQKFITFGLCSGADDSLHAIALDDRIVGTVMLDGFGYRNLQYHLRRWLWWRPRLLVQRVVNRRIKRFVPSCLVPASSRINSTTTDSPTQQPTRSTLLPGEDIREFPAQAETSRILREYIDRGGRGLFLYTGGVAHYYNGQHQFAELFPQFRDIDSIQARFFPHLDHVLQLREDREQIVNHVTAWIVKNFDPTSRHSPPLDTCETGEASQCQTAVMV